MDYAIRETVWCLVSALTADPLALIPRDLVIQINKAFSSNSSYTNNDFRTDQSKLITQIMDASDLLLVIRIPILWRPAFNNIRDVAIATIKINDT